MNKTLKGSTARDDFYSWLNNAKFALPQLMTLKEARELYERKLKDDEKVKDENFSTISQHKSKEQYY